MDDGLYVIIAGAGKVGWNLARELLEKGHEVTCIEQDRRRYLTVEQELEHAVQYGDATELWVLERAGIQRAETVVAAGDEVLVVLDPGIEDDITAKFVGTNGYG